MSVRGSALHARMLLVVWLAALLLQCRVARAGGFLTKDGCRLLMDGKPYRAIGVNIPFLHQAYCDTWFHIDSVFGSPEKARAAIVASIDDAQKSGVAFVRFFANPGYPADIEKLYAKDPDRYWKSMDELFSLCKHNGIRLVPCLGVLGGWSAYCGEPEQKILDPGSKTYKATHGYVEQFVSRYKNDPTVLMWELTNEGFLSADVNVAGSILPKGVFPSGRGADLVRGEQDSMPSGMIVRLYKDMTAFIKKLDPNHLVESGDAGVRETSQSLKESFPKQVWVLDTLRQHIANLLESQPEPLDLISLHIYNTSEGKAGIDAGGLSYLEMTRRMIRAVHATETPLFVGEFGQSDPDVKDDPNARLTCDIIDLLEKENVALAALWVWHFPWQPELTVSSSTHPRLVKRIAVFNRKYAGLGQL